jgi:flagellar hook assembly protein FlgD
MRSGNLDVWVLDVPVTGAGDQSMGDDLMLHPTFPNPFRSTTSIRFDLAHAQRVSMRVFDTRDRLVRSVSFPREWGAGQHSLTWDGKGDRGGETGMGVFSIRLYAGGISGTSKVTLIR